MSNSSLAVERIPAHANNYYGRRTMIIDKIIIHHMAGVMTAKGCALTFQNPNRGGSSNYCIGKDGEIVVSVDEECAAGTSGPGWSGQMADQSGVTIETSNSSYGGEWPVSDKVLKSLIELVADIAKRNNLGTLVPGSNLCWHQMYAATACPGPYLLKRMQYIADEANAINTPLKSNEYRLNGLDIQRKTDYLVFYTKGKTAATNKYGIEARIINHTVTGIEKGVGKMSLDGGWVLSGHGKAATWMTKNLEIGDTVTRSGTKVIVTKKKPDPIKTLEYKINGTNVKRLADYMVCYEKRVTTGTNKYGVEARVVNDKVTAIEKYKNGNMSLKGGWVLSGHGKAAEWMTKNIKIGDKVVKKNNKIIVTK